MADLEQVRSTLIKCGARDKADKEADILKARAKRQIPALANDDKRLVQLLEEMCDYVVRRND